MVFCMLRLVEKETEWKCWNGKYIIHFDSRNIIIAEIWYNWFITIHLQPVIECTSFQLALFVSRCSAEGDNDMKPLTIVFNFNWIISTIYGKCMAYSI